MWLWRGLFGFSHMPRSLEPTQVALRTWVQLLGGEAPAVPFGGAEHYSQQTSPWVPNTCPLFAYG